MSDAKAAAAYKARQLPAKEAALFKTLLQQYELKQHKKGVKAADQILKKFPNHGETLAIKSLIIHSSLPHNHPTATSLPKSLEATHLITLALSKDPYSHITHHVASIISRADKDYASACKSLLRAREIDPDNVPLIRDSIALLTHLRRYDEAVEVRHRHFLLRPQARSAWVGLAIGHELAGEYEEAIQVLLGLGEVTKSEGDGGPVAKVEKTGFELWVIRLFMKAGKFSEGLDRLEDDLRERVIGSTVEALELQAELLVALNHLEEAEVTYRKLLESNPDRIGYYQSLLKCKGLDSATPDHIPKILFHLSSFSTSYPRASAPKRLALDIAPSSSPEFRELVSEYLRTGLERGIPSLFVDLKGLYGDWGKGEVVEALLGEWRGRLEKGEGLRDGDDSVSPPTTLLWLYYYLALHLSHPSHPSPNYPESLHLLTLALTHTPTLPELHMARAMVLKRAGDPDGAARAMEEARRLDGQDRFLNGKSGKYWLRSGEVDRAQGIFGLFTKKDAPSPGQDLTDMQCCWFLQEEGDAFLRAGDIGKALKRYNQVVKVFQDYDDDQYDFHTYSIRKATLNAYNELMRFEDVIRQQPSYLKAVFAALEIYQRLFDDPDIKDPKLSPEEELERKKAAKKAQKADSKAKKSAVVDPKKEEQTLPDADPSGVAFLKSCDPLAEMQKLLTPLEELAPESKEVWEWSFELALRQGRWLKAAKALCKAAEVDSESPTLHGQIVRFAVAADKLPEATPHLTLIKSKLALFIPNSQALLLYNSDFGQRHPTSPSAVLATSQSLFFLLTEEKAKAKEDEASPSVDGEEKKGIVGTLRQMLEKEVQPDLEIYGRALAWLVKIGWKEEAEELRKSVRERMPLAWRFASEEERKGRKETWEKEDKEEEGEQEVDGKTKGK